MTPLDLLKYYVNLLIIQYASKPKAKATISAQVTPALMPQDTTQTLKYVAPPSSGSYTLGWGGYIATPVDWDDTAEDIQGKLRMLPGLSQVTVADTDGGFIITFVGVPYIAPLLVVTESDIDTGIPAVTQTDKILALAVQDAFNLDSAVGVQLDTIGKYVGVQRMAQGSRGPVVLNDTDFRTLIRVAVLTNSAQSDLASIQDLIATFFAGEIRVYDYQNMRMSYLISSSLGSPELIEMFISQGLLPRPMAVQIAALIYAPIIDTFFGFCTYQVPDAGGNSPFNTYEDYQMDRPFLLYENAFVL